MSVMLADAFGMVRTPMGYITKEKLVFIITEDKKKTKKTLDNFAKEHNLDMIEVWYRLDDAWQETKFYGRYDYFKAKKMVFSEKEYKRLFGW